MEGRGETNVARRQLSSDDKPESPNLRDFLRVKQDDHSQARPNSLNSVLKREDRYVEARRSRSNRTLVDVIRDDPTGGANSKDAKRSWRHLREKLRLRRQGSGSSWTSSVPVPASDVPLQTSTGSRRYRSTMTRRDSTRHHNPSEASVMPESDLNMGVSRSRSVMLQRNETRNIRRVTSRYDSGGFGEDAEDEAERERAEDEEEGGTAGGGGGGGGGAGIGGGGGGEGDGDGGARMSLMALLAETDKEMGLDGSSYMMDDDEDEEEDDGAFNNCCVCMVRHKGSAFIPCGHTFCRLCSRELWVQRGNCPLCNNFILEILDIF